MQGLLERRELHGPALEGNALGDPARRELTVYLPPGYASGTQRYPVAYFLHAFGSGGRGWTNAAGFGPNVPERLDALVASGAVPPLIGVFPDGWTSLGGSQWVNSEATGRYRDYFARDVVGFVDHGFRTLAQPASRAVLGHSSGGYGALVMGRDHPELFGHLSCQSGDAYFDYCYLPDLPKAAGALLKAGGLEPWFAEFQQRARTTKLRGDDFSTVNIVAMAAAYSPRRGEPLGVELPFEPQTARIRPEVWSRWLLHDPVRFVPEHLDSFRRLSSVFIDCGSRDEYNLRWGARMIADALRAGSVDVQHEEFDDGHSGVSYRFENALRHLASRLAR